MSGTILEHEFEIREYRMGRIEIELGYGVTTRPVESKLVQGNVSLQPYIKHKMTAFINGEEFKKVEIIDAELEGAVKLMKQEMIYMQSYLDANNGLSESVKELSQLGFIVKS